MSKIMYKGDKFVHSSGRNRTLAGAFNHLYFTKRVRTKKYAEEPEASAVKSASQVKPSKKRGFFNRIKSFLGRGDR